MKTTIDIPEKALKDAMRFAHAKTKRQAILTAVEDFNGRHRMAAPATDIVIAACARHHGVGIEHDDEHLAALATL